MLMYRKLNHNYVQNIALSIRVIANSISIADSARQSQLYHKAIAKHALHSKPWGGPQRDPTHQAQHTVPQWNCIALWGQLIDN